MKFAFKIIPKYFISFGAIIDKILKMFYFQIIYFWNTEVQLTILYHLVYLVSTKFAYQF